MSEFINIDSSEKVVTVDIRFRTCGDLTITGGLISKAKTVEDIIEELGLLNTTERESRFDDKSLRTLWKKGKKGIFLMINDILDLLQLEVLMMVKVF